jgi:hypothetical protein
MPINSKAVPRFHPRIIAVASSGWNIDNAVAVIADREAAHQDHR